jgi:hypothetical protein
MARRDDKNGQTTIEFQMAFVGILIIGSSFMAFAGDLIYSVQVNFQINMVSVVAERVATFIDSYLYSFTGTSRYFNIREITGSPDEISTSSSSQKVISDKWYVYVNLKVPRTEAEKERDPTGGDTPLLKTAVPAATFLKKYSINFASDPVTIALSTLDASFPRRDPDSMYMFWW